MIVLIDNYDSFTYNLYQMLAVAKQEVKVIRNDAASIAEIKALKPTGIVISPGPKTPKEAGITVDVIKAFIEEIPILGVCLGHQAMAYAFGGVVSKAEKIVHGKSTIVFHTRRGIFKGIKLPFNAGRYHSLIVTRDHLPEIFSIEAETPEGAIMAIRHIQHPCFGVQFHPESILTSEGDKILHNFVNICKEYKK
ncbi:aminodeoxychorismate/anthranilate synthase component II [Candidatus Aerophobetes bacterium]|uniref:Aminodeoxychorismate/anthranilate synthase component II n=1 Tax=Aerophobetes bacterium TaxID=2030807 RepID=A0A2A4YM15_UNCAE|nr:MAG: aminodeoxychorismate/anthranilate synthase component II [Candidatus Aerophobetes bacterium]